MRHPKEKQMKDTLDHLRWHWVKAHMDNWNEPIVSKDPIVVHGYAVSKVDAARRVIQLTVERTASVWMTESLLRPHWLYWLNVFAAKRAQDTRHSGRHLCGYIRFFTLELISTQGNIGFFPGLQVEFKPQAEFQLWVQVKTNPCQELAFLCRTGIYTVVSYL